MRRDGPAGRMRRRGIATLALGAALGAALGVHLAGPGAASGASAGGAAATTSGDRTASGAPATAGTRSAARAGRTPGADPSRVLLGPRTGGTSAFVAWPSGAGAAPGVIVVHESWGLDAPVRDFARRLAREGYVAIVPDLHRGRVATGPEKARQLAGGLNRARALADLHAAARWLRSQPRTSRSRTAVVGLGMGGSLAQAFGMDTSRVSAVAMFYGAPETDSSRIARLAAPLLAHFGAVDEEIPLTRVGAFQAALRKSGRMAEVQVYPGAGHAFMSETRPSYREDAARRAWARTVAFLGKHLRGKPAAG